MLDLKMPFVAKMALSIGWIQAGSPKRIRGSGIEK
jgi:hypothetical protein